jgi:hypothetical protein
MKTGDFVQVTYCGQRMRCKLLLASPNGRSLMLGFEGALFTSSGGAFFGSMPVLQDEDGTYRDLMAGDPIEIEPPTR